MVYGKPFKSNNSYKIVIKIDFKYKIIVNYNKN